MSRFQHVILVAGLVTTALSGISSSAQASTGAVWASISTGRHTCGVHTNHTLWCWGDNSAGDVGDGTVGRTAFPTQVGTDTHWASVSNGLNHTCGIRTDHTAWCWGDNTHGEIGDGTSGAGTNPLTPKRVGTKANWASISALEFNTCGVRTDHTLWCWGDDSAGQIGDGTTGTDRRTPKQVGTKKDWATISTGIHTCGVRIDHTLWCWGSNTNGEIGDGTSGTNRPTPKRIGTKTDWASIDAGLTHTCGVRTDHTAWCWGYNPYGEVGDGTSGTNRLRPTRVGTKTNWASISAGLNQTCGVRTDHTAWCWGYNAFGQIGDGTTSLNRVSPTRVGTKTDWASISARTETTCGVRTDHTAWCWGRNDRWQIGGTVPNDAESFRSPTKI